MAPPAPRLVLHDEGLAELFLQLSARRCAPAMSVAWPGGQGTITFTARLG